MELFYNIFFFLLKRRNGRSKSRQCGQFVVLCVYWHVKRIKFSCISQPPSIISFYLWFFHRKYRSMQYVRELLCAKLIMLYTSNIQYNFLFCVRILFNIKKRVFCYHPRMGKSEMTREEKSFVTLRKKKCLIIIYKAYYF